MNPTRVPTTLHLDYDRDTCMLYQINEITPDQLYEWAMTAAGIIAVGVGLALVAFLIWLDWKYGVVERKMMEKQG